MTYLQNSIYHNISAFCSSLQSLDPHPVNLSCPLDPGSHAFGFNIQLNDDYVFGTIVPMIQVLSPDIPAHEYICLSFPLTPRLTPPLTVTFSIVPLAICLLVAFATLFAAVYNPWTGTTNLLRATSNFGHDPDALRLITPGFSDCWYYIQFAVYTACLSLNYPGFYQPVLSRVAWSNLLFNTTLLHGGNETLSWSTVTTSLDGKFDNSTATLINIVNGSDYGLTQYASLVGIPAKDVWPTFMVWLLLVFCGITILTGLVFALFWVYKTTRGEHTTNFGTTNICFLGGMILRIWQLFYVVLVTLCCYQLVIADQSPTFAVGLSAVTLILLGMAAPAALIWVLARYAPREHLYADLHPLLVLGPLYNTYSEPKFLFAGCVFLIRLLQGIVVGAVQASGIAQITLLAVLEISFLCMINGWRPFHPRTNMNGWHTFMSIVRLVIILFLVAFIPNISVSAGVRGWIGYTLLAIHAAVLIFVFVINVVQTIVEVSARMAGAGEDSARREREFGLGNVFGINQLMKRGNSSDRPRDMDYADEAPEQKRQSQQHLSRNSSQGGSSGYGILETGSYISRGSSTTPGTTPLSPYTDRRNTMSPVSTHSGGYAYFPRTNNGDNPMSPINPQPPQPIQPDPRIPAYYRQPRRSHAPASPIGQIRFDTSAERENLDTAVRSAFIENIDDPRASTTPPRIGSPARTLSHNETKPRPNYAVREADAFYYRRPDYSQPLNPDPTARRLGTGPADPTGPLAIASTWLKGVFRGNPEKGKFEVVRGNAARATDIPLTENNKGEDGSRPSSAGRGEDVRSPLVVDPHGRIVEENEDSIYEEDLPSSGLPLAPQPTMRTTTREQATPAISEIDLGSQYLDPRKSALPSRFPVVLNSDTDDDEYRLPPQPPKNPNRGSVSSLEDVAGPSGPIFLPPSIPRKSSARQSPHIPSEIPWSQGERVQQVKTGRGVWTEQEESSRESVGQVRDSADLSDEE